MIASPPARCTIHSVAGKSLWVLIPVHNEEGRVLDTLEALEHQSDQDFTLCVIDNASTDRSAAIVTAFAGRSALRVVLLSEPDKGVGCAIDTGARHAIAHGADWIGRTDADTLPATTWVMELKRAFSHGGELIVGSMRARSDETGPAGRALFAAAVSLAAFFGRLRPAHRDGHGPYVMHAGFNMGVTAALYERCGGMPRRPSPTDRLFMNAVRRAGGRVVRAPRMRALTSARRFGALGVLGTARWYLDRGAHTEDPR
jgi:glycosyltransferase involved in cell wall biosynthesis